MTNNKLDTIKEILNSPTMTKFKSYNNKFYRYKFNHWVFTPKSDILKYIPEVYRDEIIKNDLFTIMLEYISSLKFDTTHNIYSINYWFNKNTLKFYKRSYMSKIDINPSDTYIESDIVDSVFEKLSIIPLEGAYLLYKEKIPPVLASTNNFKQFMQFYLAALLHIPVKTFAAIEVNSGFLSFYKQLQSIIPNDNIHFGKLEDYLTHPDMYILSLNYKDSKNIVKFPDVKIVLTNEEIYGIIAYSFGSLYNFSNEIDWKIIDYTPPIIDKKINVSIAEKLKMVSKLYKVEDLGYSEIMNILSILYDELDEKTYNSIYSIMYNKFIEEQKE